MCGIGDAVLNVHHKTYCRRGREEPGDLIVLCRNCHTGFHKKNTDRLVGNIDILGLRKGMEASVAEHRRWCGAEALDN